MTDITAAALAYWAGLNLTEQQRADLKFRSYVIEAFEQGWMQHEVHCK